MDAYEWIKRELDESGQGSDRFEELYNLDLNRRTEERIDAGFPPDLAREVAEAEMKAALEVIKTRMLEGGGVFPHSEASGINEEFEKIIRYQYRHATNDPVLDQLTQQYLDMGMPQDSAHLWAKSILDASPPSASVNPTNPESSEPSELEETSEPQTAEIPKVNREVEPEETANVESKADPRIAEIRKYLDAVERKTFGTENPDNQAVPPHIPYWEVTVEQLEKMPPDQFTRHCFDALKLRTNRLLSDKYFPEGEALSEVRAEAGALLEIDNVLGRLGDLDRYILEELVRQPCSLSTARERANGEASREEARNPRNINEGSDKTMASKKGGESSEKKEEIRRKHEGSGAEATQREQPHVQGDSGLLGKILFVIGFVASPFILGTIFPALPDLAIVMIYAAILTFWGFRATAAGKGVGLWKVTCLAISPVLIIGFVYGVLSMISAIASSDAGPAILIFLLIFVGFAITMLILWVVLKAIFTAVGLTREQEAQRKALLAERFRAEYRQGQYGQYSRLTEQQYVNSRMNEVQHKQNWAGLADLASIAGILYMFNRNNR
jgi:hypothetical protein